MQTKTAEEILSELAAPFEDAEVKFKPAVVNGNRAMALAYVDARVVQDRLDDVLGVENWQDDYETKEEGSVVCRLRLRIGNEWITKVDVGSPSEQPDGGDRLKAAFSDALKRAAVKFGIGRYLYRAPNQWVDYDTSKRCFVRPPQLPAQFRAPQQPAKKPPAKPANGQTPKAEEPSLPPLRDKILPLLEAAAAKGVAALQGCWVGLSRHEQKACEKDKEPLKLKAAAIDDAKRKAPPPVPTTGAELLEACRCLQKEFPQVAPGAFLNGVMLPARNCKFPDDVQVWTGAQVKTAVGWLEGLREDAIKAIEESQSAVA